LKVRIGPVPRATEGDLLMWPGTGAELFTEQISVEKASLRFSEATLFRNSAPVTSAGINFRLTKASPHTYGGTFEPSASAPVDLGGYENGAVMRVRFPGDLSLHRHMTVDICLVLKEPTLAVDFTAEFSDGETPEECLRAIAKSIVVNAGLIGERVYAGVARDQERGGYDLYVTKPYLVNGMFNIHFAPGRSPR
jgi:hypothetical protein